MVLPGQRLDMGRVLGWVQRLAGLDTTVFNEVRGDATATLTALAIVVVASFLSGLGAWLWVLVNLRDLDMIRFFIDSVILGSLFHIALWFVWVFIAYVVLTQIFRTRADSTHMVRTMGLATLPMAFSFLMFIPVLDWTVGLVSIVATVLLMNYAIQAATTAPAAQVNIANLAGFAVLALVLSYFASSVHFRAPGLYAFDSWKDVVLLLPQF